MRKLSWGFFLFLFFGIVGFSAAQDMPPLPDLPNSQAAPADNTSMGAQTLPPLPGDQVISASPQPPMPGAGTADSSSAGLPPLPGETASSSAQGNSSNSLPPIPGQSSSTVAPAAPASSNSSLPPLPGQAADTNSTSPAPPSDQVQFSATPGENPTPQATPGVTPKHKKKHLKPWQETKWRPNAIYGGWVMAKGGNSSSRLSWTSQEILNALEFHKYKFLKEDGHYDGQAGGPQWRSFDLRAPKSKEVVQVYISPVGTKVWMRVGPSEPPAPANHSIAQVRNIQKESLKALALIRKEMRGRLKPHYVRSDWEASYNYNRDTADE